MKSRGYRVMAVASPGALLDQFGRDEGIEVYPLEMPRRITPLGDLVAMLRLAWFFWKLRPDIVHGHTPKGGLLSMMAASLAGVRGRVYTMHGLPLETASGFKRTLLRWTERLSCALAGRVTCVSQSLRRRAAGLGIARAEDIEVLAAGTTNGVDGDRRFAPWRVSQADAARTRRALGIPTELRVLGFVGRIVRDKGVEDLLEAWKELREEFPDLQLAIVGPEEPHDPLSPEAQKLLRSDPRIRLTGYVESMPSAYAVMDIVTLPSYREGYPNVPLEAGAMERPVVATRVTGCVDAVVDGETGTLVPPRDPRALAEALRAYLNDPELRRKHGKAARQRVLRDYRPERIWLHTSWIYEDLLKRRPDSRNAPRRHQRAPRPRPAIDLLIKRSVDVAGALAGLVVLSPVFAVLSFLILVVLGRPIFFRQARPGLKGRVFPLVKFRSMRPGQEPDEVRMGWLGQFLRSTSLDEIPQLWNVLRGDMSLVGPRPLLVQYLEHYSREQARRHDVRPGMTGWVQVNGRNSLTWGEKFELDCWYVDNGSLRLDLSILMRTVARVLARTGINGPGNAAVPLFAGPSQGLRASLSHERRLARGTPKQGPSSA
jgi:lipopolysaccharide/colanic/teichoic acid biosynthesis glycosyltransferase/glycosyltransferase involved in cell wall biosynthesis